MKIDLMDLQHDLATWGNAYIEIKRAKTGQIIGMERLYPPAVALDYTKNGVKGYRVITEPGESRVGQDILAHCKVVKQGEFVWEVYGGSHGKART